MQQPEPPVTPVGQTAPLPPAASLAYATPLRRGRPGFLTAVGVMSIIIASLSALFCLQTGASAAGFFMISRVAKSRPAFSNRSGVAVSSSVTVVGPGGVKTTTTTPATAPATVPSTAGPGAVAPLPTVDPAACILVGAEAVASFALAVLLMVAGIMTLRDSRKAVGLHRVFIWFKLPLGVLGGIAYGWMMSQFVASAAGPSSPGLGRVLFVTYALMIGALACAYPIGLFFTLRSRSVRAWYQSVAAAG